MSITTAVANAAAAAAAGAGKKAAQVQLQAELNTDDAFHKFLQKDGLLVVDVYTEWCGPCIGMVGNLKKIKVEIGGDNLHLAVAKADTIECLKRFRNRSEPTWMFLAGGQLLNVVFGADAPRLARTIEEELRNEEAVKRGERERPQRAPHELTSPEQETALALEKLQQQRREKEAAALLAEREARREARAVTLEAYYADVCPALVLPHAQKNLRRITDALEPYGLILADKCPLVVGKDSARALSVEDPLLKTSEALTVLAERPALALLIKKQSDKEGNVIELTRQALFGDGVEQGDGEPKKFVAEELSMVNVPGLFVPADRHQRAAALDLLFPKMVSGVAPMPARPTPPRLAVVLAAWQRRAALAVATAPRLLQYGFFADDNLDEPKLLCKTIDQYELREEKDYCETIVLMYAVGVAEPELVDPGDIPPKELPEELLALGPLHISEDTVVGAEECSRFFPPGYNEPEQKPKTKSKKKKKKRNETKDETIDESTGEAGDAVEETENLEGSADVDGDGSAEAEIDEEYDKDGDDEDGVEANHADKATSPLPNE